MDENNNSIPLGIADFIHKRNADYVQMRQNFEENGSKDMEDDATGEPNFAVGYNRPVETINRIKSDSKRAPYFSEIWKPLPPPKHCSVAKQIFALPNIVPLALQLGIEEKHNTLEGFGSISVPSTYPVQNSPPLVSKVFETAAKQTLLMHKKKMHCKICAASIKNHPDRIYLSHRIQNSEGKVTCPTLRNYVCQICQATGDGAHTEKYCPQNPQKAIQKYADTAEIRCQFCLDCIKSKHSDRIISSHNVKDPMGNVQCPTLRKYKCPRCGATGNDAHTLTYCPNIVYQE